MWTANFVHMNTLLIYKLHFNKYLSNLIKTSNASPIPKSGDVHDPANYRPISQLPVISKGFERHVYSLLGSCISIIENQWGFLSGHSSSGALLSALHDWMRHLNNGHETIALFCYLSKAFHIPSCWICSLASMSPWILLPWSVHISSNCSVLGPLLFIIYIDQIARLPLNDGTIVLYTAYQFYTTGWCWPHN